jgi:DNA transposition AAA+ family ATPase
MVMDQVNTAHKGNQVKSKIEHLLETGVTQAEIARQSGVSQTALSRWLKGDYPGNNVEIERKLAAYLDAYEAVRDSLSQRAPAPEWVPTETAQRVIALLRFAQLFGVMALVFGGAGVGKTRAVRRYVNTGTNVWLATMTDASAGLVSSLQVIVAALGLKEQGGALQLFRAIIAKVTGTRGLLVIDEAQHLSINALEQIRAISDETGIGIVLMGNESVYSRMAGGARAPYLDRLRSRISRQLRLIRPTARDCRDMLEAYGLGNAGQKLAEQIAAKPGALRVLCTTLDLARSYAAAASEPLAQGHFAAAWAELSAEG